MILAKIRVTGVRAILEDANDIPAGIIGGKVRMEYADPLWDGLSKTVVFRGRQITKDVLNAGELVNIPPEIAARPGDSLFVGVYGTDVNGNIAIPTLWADLGRVRAAADPSGDTSTDESLPVWAQLQEQINDLRENGSPESGGGGKPGADGFSPVAKVEQTETGAVISITDKNGTTTATVSNGKNYVLTDGDKQEIAEMAAGMVEVPDSGGNSALTAEQIAALDGMFKIASFTADPTNAYKAFKTAFGIADEEEPDEPVVPDEPEVTMTGISAVYSGGDVAVGTALTDLTGIVVTAMYSDGTSETVTGYTLSGEIAEGSNTVTVSYGGKTTTIAVTGVAESSGVEEIDLAQYLKGNYHIGTVYNNALIRWTAKDDYELYCVPVEQGITYRLYYTAPDSWTNHMICNGQIKTLDSSKILLYTDPVTVDFAGTDQSLSQAYINPESVTVQYAVDQGDGTYLYAVDFTSPVNATFVFSVSGTNTYEWNLVKVVA